MIDIGMETHLLLSKEKVPGAAFDKEGNSGTFKELSLQICLKAGQLSSKLQYSASFEKILLVYWINSSGDHGSHRAIHTKDFQKSYLISPSLTLNVIQYVSRVRWSNPRKGKVPPTYLVDFEIGTFVSASITLAKFTYIWWYKNTLRKWTHAPVKIRVSAHIFCFKRKRWNIIYIYIYIRYHLSLPVVLTEIIKIKSLILGKLIYRNIYKNLHAGKKYE